MFVVLIELSSASTAGDGPGSVSGAHIQVLSAFLVNPNPNPHFEDVKNCLICELVNNLTD